jgi:hypothetical protein
MAELPLLFEIYRLNIVDEETFMFDFMGVNIRTDDQILQVIKGITNPDLSVITQSGRSTLEWNAREFFLVNSDHGPVCSVTLGRSTIEQNGKTATADGFEEATTMLSPPPAETFHVFFYMRRHLVVVEYRSELMRNQLWRNSLHNMLDKVSAESGFTSHIRLEPVPEENKILQAFQSFDRLTRLRVKLRIPNPELDRRTERLRREMVANGIREYTQDMKNPSGLSLSEEGLPFATAAMAQAGYKDGEVTMTGFRNGQRRTVRTGNKAMRGRIEGFRDFVRGMSANVRTVEGKNILARITEEVDKLAELPTPPGHEQ